MLRRLKKLLARKPAAIRPEPDRLTLSETRDFTFESLRDDYERRTWHYDDARPTPDSSNPRLLNWIGSIDRSGYTREKCLRALIANFEPGDENRILLRLSDWVPQVRTVAREWVLSCFRSLSSDAIKENQGLILYLFRKHRLQNDAGMHEIRRDLLRRTGGMARSEFFGFTPMFRRFLFSLSLADDGHLRPWISDDPEPFNRLLLLSDPGFSGLTEDEKRRLRADKSVFVRRRLFYSQLEAGISPDRDELTALALDPNRSLRELGRFYLKRNFDVDAYAIYRALDGDRYFYIADYARTEDADRFLEGIRSGSRNTQYNCLGALAAAAPERLRELGISELISRNRRFRSVVIPLLPRLLSIEEILALRPEFEKSSPHGAISFFRVLEWMSFWTFVDEALTALLSDPDPALRQTIVHAIQSKVEVFEPLSPQLRKSICARVSALRKLDPGRSGKLADYLDFIIGTT